MTNLWIINFNKIQKIKMGALIMKAISKTGTESVSSQAASLLEIGAKNIDGVDIA